MSKAHHTAGPSLSQNLALLLARVPLGLYLLFVGYAHVTGGLGHFADHNDFVLNHLIPPTLAGGLLRCVPVAELAGGAFLVLGIFSRTGGLLASLALLTLIVTQVRDLGRQGEMPFNPLLILCGFALCLAFAGAGGLSLDRLVWGKRA